ncbi:NAD-binding protein [Favolaschia claudopus]|uniref:NAD-binding protein n=1 Tax=Favolaschia claudopus TaxID=2862362 RepID=A0AAW0DYR2_9AGAR
MTISENRRIRFSYITTDAPCVVLLTGGNSGIGYATIQILARRGAKVYMATRNESRAKEAIQRMKSEGIGAGSVEWLHLDLSDPRSAARAVQTFLAKEQRLDLLINNAAVGAGPFKLTSDGLLDIMVTNHISHVILTNGLLPLLKQTAAEPRSDVRIIALSSAAHSFVDPDSFATRESLNKDYGNSMKGALNTYGYSKLACMLYFKALQKRLDADGTRITCVSVHPGAIRTPGGESVFAGTPVIGFLFAKVIMPMMFGSWKDGALPVLYAAAGPREKFRDAAYVTPKGVEVPSKAAVNARLSEEVYETTERVVKELNL